MCIRDSNSPAPITGKAKIGSVYIGVDSTDGEYGTPAILTTTKVQLTCSEKGKGKISIPFSNEEELERIMETFDTLKK